MKKIISILLVLFMLSTTTAFAQETEQSNTELPEPGTTPDSFLYFLDLAMENMELALTFDTDAKVEKKLEFATERLSEARAMALEGEFEAMAEAVNEHDRIMTELEIEIEEMSDEDPEESEQKFEYEARIEKHDEKVNDFKQEIEIEIEIEGDLTPEQQEQIDELINSILSTLDENAGEVEIEIEIENESGETSIEIEQEIEFEEDDEEEEELNEEKTRQALVNTMDQIIAELSIDPTVDHEILSSNFEVEGDSLSGSVEARTDEVLDLNSLKDQLLAGTSGWESGDVSVEGDSLDITFEKDYPVVEIEGMKYIPSSSVTLSVTVYEDDGFSDGNYDIDITLEEVEEEIEEEEE
ncbi:DUF5667 domain-containing protein [Methanolobus sp. WCC5]|uniref:DUF5667 domain-containing protein n=1 Tax=Methanolobus sp. WCC5 TaxID=3125785 RepID=UPI00324C89AF